MRMCRWWRCRRRRLANGLARRPGRAERRRRGERDDKPLDKPEPGRAVVESGRPGSYSRKEIPMRLPENSLPMSTNGTTDAPAQDTPPGTPRATIVDVLLDNLDDLEFCKDLIAYMQE